MEKSDFVLYDRCHAKRQQDIIAGISQTAEGGDKVIYLIRHLELVSLKVYIGRRDMS